MELLRFSVIAKRTKSIRLERRRFDLQQSASAENREHTGKEKHIKTNGLLAKTWLVIVVAKAKEEKGKKSQMHSCCRD